MLKTIRRILQTRCVTLPDSGDTRRDYDTHAVKLSKVSAELEKVGDPLRGRIKKLFGRSLRIREVDTGSCNACEWEITALTNPIYDISRFGIDFVASPRHADMLLVTGPVTRQMETALLKTYEATPNPKIVVAVGDCACGLGPFGKSYAAAGGLHGILPIDHTIQGCPPSPLTLLQGILKAIDLWDHRTPRSGN